MSDTIDARGLSCPQPVLLTKKGLESKDRLEVTVDNKTAVENVTRMAQSQNCSVRVEERGGAYVLYIARNPSPGGDLAETKTASPQPAECGAGELVAVLSGETMGRGDEGLGRVLVRSFLHTMTEMDEVPGTLILYNAGVRLAVRGSEVLADLEALEARGVELLVCGTCLNYFGIAENLAVGKVSNMYDIAGVMTSASRLVMP